ncbi:hypothetical protein ACJW31_01G362800 [Castanea mollissima]
MNLSVSVRLSNSQSYRFPWSQLGIPILSHDMENLSEIGAKRFSVKPWLWCVSILCVILELVAMPIILAVSTSSRVIMGAISPAAKLLLKSITMSPGMMMKTIQWAAKSLEKSIIKVCMSY